jgi:penicillin-binding protein 2
MQEVVHGQRGTAKVINKDLDYHIAGKTGTAQVVGIKQDEEYDRELVAERNRDHALFIAFAPVEHPQIAVSVLVENGEHGSSTAAPLARQIIDAYMALYPQNPSEGFDESK